MTPMGVAPTLAEFLLARLAEDKGQALDQIHAGMDGYVNGWSCERVLAECAAKRQVVERYQQVNEHPDPSDADLFVLDEYEHVILPVLALPYAGHPDYRALEWAPRPAWALS